jgi:hypothetical protein
MSLRPRKVFELTPIIGEPRAHDPDLISLGARRPVNWELGMGLAGGRTVVGLPSAGRRRAAG